MEIIKIKKGQYSWIEIFGKFILPGRPFILAADFTSQWSCRSDWIFADGSPNLANFIERYGKYRVPVVDCNGEYETEPLKMTVEEYLSGIISNDNLYLKDWHFQSQCKASSVYNLPPCLSTDWINNEEWTENRNNPTGGDYRFLYFGAKVFMTPFHSDVLSTHSWSANICGKKQWFLLPKGGEEYFRKNRNQFIRDIRTKPEMWEKAGVASFIQDVGEIVFIPSNFYHQVHNLEMTISLNHNSINSSNISLVWQFLQQKYDEIRHEISDVEPSFSKLEFEAQIQLIMKADARLNYSSLLCLLDLVINSRCNQPSALCYVCHAHLDPRECFQNSSCLSARSSHVCTCEWTKCEECSSFLSAFELTLAIRVKDEIKERNKLI